MKKLVFILAAWMICLNGYAQQTDSLLLGKWNLFQIIDNLTGDEIQPPVNPNPAFTFSIVFAEDSLVKFNAEINKCDNRYLITGVNQIKFLYYSTCTQICCDKEFSALLTYEECTGYYIKDGSTLILVSEDRIFYFKRDSSH